MELRLSQAAGPVILAQMQYGALTATGYRQAQLRWQRGYVIVAATLAAFDLGHYVFFLPRFLPD
jgi:hypothetical protein